MKKDSNDDDQKQFGWLPLTKNIQGSTAGNKNNEAERLTSEATHKINQKNMCLIYPTRFVSTTDTQFKKQIRVLVRDPDYDETHYRHVSRAMKDFDECTQGMMSFTMCPYYFTNKEVNVVKTNWINATYKVLLAAKKRHQSARGAKIH